MFCKLITGNRSGCQRIHELADALEILCDVFKVKKQIMNDNNN